MNERLSSSREKNKGTYRRRNMDEKSCVTPAGTSNEFDVQNKWGKNTDTHTHSHTTVGCQCLPVIWTLPFIVFKEKSERT